VPLAFLTYEDVAQRLRCAVGTVRRLVRLERLRSPRWIEGIGLRFLEADVEVYLMDQWTANRTKPKRKRKPKPPPESGSRQEKTE
jgi:excisionase family DNA binding protein